MFASCYQSVLRHRGSHLPSRIDPAVTQKFFDELAAVLDRVAVFQEPIYVVGDLNIRLDRDADHNADQLRLLVDCYGLVLHGTGQTHQLGGTLDIVISHGTVDRPGNVAVEDVDLSDQFLLKWKVGATRPASYSTVVQTRPWSRLDMESFRSAVATSKLYQPDPWPLDIDEMAALYNSEINGLLDQLFPLRQVVRRQRSSDPYFDKECRDAKRLTRRLERANVVASRRAPASPNVAVRSRVGPDDVTAAAAAAKLRGVVQPASSVSSATSSQERGVLV